MAAGGMISRYIGAKYFELAKAWAPTGAAFGATATALGLYLSDWKAVVVFIPYYGSKFQEPKE